VILNGIAIPDPDEGWLYLDAIVLIKCMDDQGDIRYKEIKSAGLTPVEALGMAETYSDTMRAMLMRRATRDDYGD
jgi:hypothetical protein